MRNVPRSVPVWLDFELIVNRFTLNRYWGEFSISYRNFENWLMFASAVTSMSAVLYVPASFIPKGFIFMMRHESSRDTVSTYARISAIVSSCLFADFAYPDNLA